MHHTDGRQRVVVERILPEVEEGKFAVKRAVGETVDVTAHVFSDGHDRIRAELMYTPAGGEKQQVVEMKAGFNDEWTASFPADAVGVASYTVRAWIDAFRTWQSDARKKYNADQDISVELAMGAELLAQAAERAEDRDRAKLESWANVLKDKTDQEQAILLAMSPDVTELVERYPDRRFCSQYPRELKVEINRRRALFSAWYELFPRSCGPGRQHGTFADCEQLLPDIAGLGFDVLYLPPIHPIGTAHRKGKNNSPTCESGDPGSPWAIGAPDGGHKAVHPELGTLDDFRRFTVQAREHGLEVALDLAFQCSPDHPYVKEHPEWFRWRPDGTVQYAENPPKKYEDVLPLNFETDQWWELWQELKRVVLFWIDQGVRIFRVDNPHTKPFPFWEWLIGQVRQDYPDVIFLAEAFTRPKVLGRLAKVGFDQSYTYFTWRNTKPELTQYLEQLTTGEIAEYLRPNFWPNTPDILPQYLQFGGRPAFFARLVLAATLSSSYGIYGPAFELCIAEGVEGKEEYLDSEKYEIKDWDREAPGNIRGLVERLNRVRRENSSLQNIRSLRFCDVDNDMLIAYVKSSPEMDNVTVTVVNLDPHHKQSGWVRLPLTELDIDERQPYMAHDLLSNDKYIWQGQRNYIELDPALLSAHILRIHKRLRRETDFDYFM